MKKHVRGLNLMALLGLVSAFGCGGPEGAQAPNGVEPVEAEKLVERPSKPKYDAALAGPSALKVAPIDQPPCDITSDDCDLSGGGSGGGTPTVSSTFLSSQGRGGYGAIRDLKITKGDSANQPTLSGYHLIDMDLNKGAGGTYIYLTFTRDPSSVKGPKDDYCSPLIDGPYVTHIFADDYNALSAVGAKNSCLSGSAPPIWEPTMIWEPSMNFGWKHPELNDGSGGRFIFAWQHKSFDAPPIQEVGVLAGNSGSIQCPFGWTRVEQDLNEGAGGAYIYFCWRR